MLAIRSGPVHAFRLAPWALSFISCWWKLAPPGLEPCPPECEGRFSLGPRRIFFHFSAKSRISESIDIGELGHTGEEGSYWSSPGRTGCFPLSSGGRPSSRKNDDENNGFWRIALVSGDNHQGVDEIACATVLGAKWALGCPELNFFVTP